jgi:hypothetical protein
MALPTIELVVSRCLFHTDTLPVDIKNESLIRPAGKEDDHSKQGSER